MIIVCLFTMCMISWQLTLFVFILLPIAGTIMGKVGKKLKRKSLENQNQWGVLMSNIEETLGGLRIIKAFNAEEKVRRRFHKENQELYNLSNKVARRQSLAHPMSEFLGTTAIAIVLWFGGSLILNGATSMTASSFIYYLVIFYNIINPAKELSKAAYSIQKGMASMERVDKILSADNPIKDPASPTEIKSLKGNVSYKNVSFSYGANEVLHNIDLEIPAGATVALVGQSGSGKSTLADLLPRFYDVQHGKISVDGVDVRDMRVQTCAHSWATSTRKQSSSTTHSTTTLPSAWSTPRWNRWWRLRRLQTPTNLSSSRNKATTPISATADAVCQAASASACQ